MDNKDVIEKLKQMITLAAYLSANIEEPKRLTSTSDSIIAECQRLINELSKKS